MPAWILSKSLFHTKPVVASAVTVRLSTEFVGNLVRGIRMKVTCNCDPESLKMGTDNTGKDNYKELRVGSTLSGSLGVKRTSIGRLAMPSFYTALSSHINNLLAG